MEPITSRGRYTLAWGCQFIRYTCKVAFSSGAGESDVRVEDEAVREVITHSGGQRFIINVTCGSESLLKNVNVHNER